MEITEINYQNVIEFAKSICLDAIDEHSEFCVNGSPVTAQGFSTSTDAKGYVRDTHLQDLVENFCYESFSSCELLINTNKTLMVITTMGMGNLEEAKNRLQGPMHPDARVKTNWRVDMLVKNICHDHLMHTAMEFFHEVMRSGDYRKEDR